MKVFVLLCVVSMAGLAYSYPRPDDQQQGFRRRNGLARRQLAEAADEFPTADYERQVPRYSRKTLRRKAGQQYQPQGDFYAPQPPSNYAERSPLRRQQEEESPVLVNKQPDLKPENLPTYPVVAKDSAPAQSGAYNAYESGSYDTEHQKFEESVRNSASAYNPEQGVDDGRLHFAIHGQQGPNSYRFGYDTGKGNNRVFRYEERDAEGIVHGRYGYYDSNGKLRVVNYTAHPKHGYQAEGNFGPK